MRVLCFSHRHRHSAARTRGKPRRCRRKGTSAGLVGKSNTKKSHQSVMVFYLRRSWSRRPHRCQQWRVHVRARVAARGGPLRHRQGDSSLVASSWSCASAPRSEAGRLRGATVHQEPIASPNSACLREWRGQHEQKKPGAALRILVEDATAY